jgi:uncharacterized protein (TIGR03435 family)
MHKVLLMAMIWSAMAGAKTPDLAVDAWLQAPPGFQSGWDALRGKVVVVEFWATWCAPCVAAIPHMNQLAQEFHGKDVVFLAITDDPMDKMLSFLKTHTMEAVIGVDTKRANWKSFEIPSIPHTLVVGRDGVVIGATYPEEVTSAVLREVLAGGRPSLPVKEGVPSDLEWDRQQIVWQDGVVPEMYAIVKPIKTTTGGSMTGPTHYTADGVPLQVMVQAAWQAGQFRMDWRVPKSDIMYRAAVRVPEGRGDQLWPYLRATLTAMLGIRAAWEDQERDVWVLRRIEGTAPPAESKADKELKMQLRGKITLHRQPPAVLCDFLTNALGKPVLDESGLAGLYDYDLPYQPGQKEVITTALREAGLAVLAEKRRIPVLVVGLE